MVGSSSRRHDHLVSSPEGSWSDSSSTGNTVSRAPRANVASNSPLGSITRGHGASSSGVRTVSDDRSLSKGDASVGASPSVYAKEISVRLLCNVNRKWGAYSHC
ncbi:hypothetical protein ACOSP7_027001 [Xanthoceras sorbifolium]